MDSTHKSGHPGTGGLGALLAAQTRRLGHAPLLTYYDDDTGERTELSYATFDNWAAKAANLLTEEMGSGRHRRVVLGPNRHWTAAVIAAAAWKIGAVVVLGGQSAPEDVLVVAEEAAPDSGHPAERLLVIGPEMGGRVAGNPPGVHFGDEVLAFADDYDDPAVSIDDPAVADSTGERTSAELLQEATAVAGDADRILSLRRLDSIDGVVQTLVAPLAGGGSVVWCVAAEGVDLAGRAAEERATLLADDRGVRGLTG
jgi:uncharacterized protein (TIGR03089 family)